MDEQSIFIQALEQPAGELRQRWLDQACGDPALRTRVVGLLECHEQAGSFLDRPAVEVFVRVDDSAAPPVHGVNHRRSKSAPRVDKQITKEKFIDRLVRSMLMTAEEVAECESALEPLRIAPDAHAYAQAMVRAKKLTRFQARAIYEGRIKGLTFGDYVILDQLGKGGMGIVYKAQHRRMDRLVAIKVLPRSAMATKGAVKRFYREVKTAAKLMHANIVAALDAGENDGLHYLVMEFVNGQDLGEILQRTGPLPPQQAVDCILQVARGLQFAHDQGVIHRDIKPANLLMDRNGTVKILDMGLARVTGAADDDDQQRSITGAVVSAEPVAGTVAPSGVAETVPLEQDTTKVEGETRLTKAGEVMGTLDYMPPEQFNNTRGVDERGDIYSLGCTLYMLLTNQRPFPADTLGAIVYAHHHAPIPSLRATRTDILEQVDAVFQRMLAKEVAQRQASMAQVIEELEAALSPTQPMEPVPVEPLQENSTENLFDSDSQNAMPSFALSTAPNTIASRDRYSRRHSKLAPWVAVGGVACALLITGALIVWRGWPSDREEDVRASVNDSAAPESFAVSDDSEALAGQAAAVPPRNKNAIDAEANRHNEQPLRSGNGSSSARADTAIDSSGIGSTSAGGLTFGSFANRLMSFIDNGKNVSITEDNHGITVSIDGRVVTAADAAELKKKDREAYGLYERALGLNSDTGPSFKAPSIPSAQDLQREQLEKLLNANPNDPQKALIEKMLLDANKSSR